MSNTTNLIKGPSEFVIDSVEKFNLLQYEQASNAYRDLIGHLIKLVVMFVTINVLLTGFAFRSDQPAAFGLAALTGLTLIIIIRHIYRLTIPALCTGIELEDRANEFHDRHPINSPIVTNMILIALGSSYIESLRKIVMGKDINKRFSMLKKIKTPFVGPNVRLLCVLLSLVSILQVILYFTA